MGCFKTLKISRVTFKYAQLVKTHGNYTVPQIIYLKDRYMFLYVELRYRYYIYKLSMYVFKGSYTNTNILEVRTELSLIKRDNF